MRKLSEKLSGVSLKSSSKQASHPFVENDAFEGIGDEDLWINMVMLKGTYKLQSRHFFTSIGSVILEMLLTTSQLVRGEFRPRQTRQLPRAVDLKGRLLSCQSY